MGTVIIIVILLFSVIIHEVSHGYAAEQLGDPTARLAGRLTLNPIPHLDLVGSFIVPALMALLPGSIIFGWAKPVPYNPYNISHKYGDAIVAGAGPLSNIALAFLFGVVVRINESIAFLPESFTAIALLAIFINIILAIFNLVPIPPLDGSKIFFNFLPYKYQHVRATLERYWIFFVLIFIFFLWQFIFPLVLYLTILFAGVPIAELATALTSFF